MPLSFNVIYITKKKLETMLIFSHIKNVRIQNQLMNQEDSEICVYVRRKTFFSVYR